MIYTEAITILHIKHGASKDEIKKAFFKLAHIHHPDKGGEAKKFVEIKSAYDFLLANDPPKTNTTYRTSGFGGFGYSSRWYNPMTGEWEDVPPTTGKTTTRSKAETEAGSYDWARKMAREQEILVKKQKIAQMKLDLRQQEFELSVLQMQKDYL